MKAGTRAPRPDPLGGFRLEGERFFAVGGNVEGAHLEGVGLYLRLPLLRFLRDPDADVLVFLSPVVKDDVHAHLVSLHYLNPRVRHGHGDIALRPVAVSLFV